MALLAAEMITNAGHEAVVLGGAMQIDLNEQLNTMHYGAAAFTSDEKALDGSVTDTDHVAFVNAARRWFDSQLAEHRPDVVHVHNCGRILSQTDLAKLSTRVPVVHTMHDEWFFTDAHYTFRSTPSSPVVRTVEPGRSDSVIEHRYEHLWDVPALVGNFTAVGPSKWISERASQVFPTLDVVHLPNAVDTSLFELQDRTQARALLGLPADRPIVLFVGSPTQERKGFALYEQAVRKAISPDGQAPMRLVAGGTGSVVSGPRDSLFGPGPIADLVSTPAMSPIGALGIGGDGLVVAGLDRSLIPALYGAADVLVHPSAIDNLPTVPIEAGLCGTHVLATNVGGTRETIADIDGLFPLATSADELASRISNALVASTSETVADRQRRRDVQLERFTIDRHQGALLALLQNIGDRGVS